jgi:hypothetical protein
MEGTRRLCGPKPGAITGAPEPWDPGCELCRFQADSVERRIGWVEAEGVNDGPFLRRFVAGGGYCPRHLRQALAGEDRERWAIPVRMALHEVGRRVAGTGVHPHFELCALCELERWTGEYGVSILASGRAPLTGGARRLGPEAFVCLRHAAAVVRAGATPTALGRLRRAVEVASGSDLQGSLSALAGPDPAGHVRHLSRQEAPEDPGLATGRSLGGVPCPGRRELGEDWLRGEIEAGRCPACSAAACAQQALFESSGSPANAVLCRAHAWDALDAAPDLLRGVLQRTLSDADAWLSEQVPAARPDRAPVAAWPGERGPSRGIGIFRRLAGRQGAAPPGVPCFVCAAQEAAVDEVLHRLDARPGTLAAAPDWRGLCLWHLVRAELEAPGSRSWLLPLARSASGSLERALEPDPGPGEDGERILWEAAVYLAGDGIARDPWRAPEADAPGSAIWPL